MPRLSLNRAVYLVLLLLTPTASPVPLEKDHARVLQTRHAALTPPPVLYLGRSWLGVPQVRQKRQTYGTDTFYTTSTTTVYVNSQNQPSGSTVTETDTVTYVPGVTSTSTQTVPVGIATTTVYGTQATPTAGIITTRTTITISRTTTTSTATRAQPTNEAQPAAATQTGVPFNYVCQPGDGNQKYPGGMSLSSTPSQKVPLYVLGIYILGILVAWNLIGFRTFLYPIKMLVVAYHEFWHILVGVCMGNRLHAIEIDPQVGGRTVFNADEPIIAPTQPVACYWAAMVGSALLGSLLVFCGFNTLASKIASFFIGLSFAAILWYASGVLTLLLTAVWIGLMIGLWFIDHALYLKYYVLFIGVATAWYFAWDIMDDLVFRKTHPCCPKQLEYRFMTAAGPALRASVVSGAWTGISFFFFVGFILLAIAVFRQTPHGEFCQSQTFLPT